LLPTHRGARNPLERLVDVGRVIPQRAELLDDETEDADEGVDEA
jgi:hypothetical protein